VRQRKAFTLVEMMIVIGVIVVLAALAVTAYTKLVNSSAEKATATTLQNAQSLLTEYEQAAGLGKLGYGDINFPYHGGYFTLSDDPDAPKKFPIGLTGLLPVVTTGFVGESGNSSDPNALPPPRLPGKPDAATGDIVYSLDTQKQKAVFNTAAVMMYIARLPQARPILSSLPTKGFLQFVVKDPNSTTGGIARGITLGGSEAPVMLDGWGNPIIYVPPGGIVVQMKGQPTLSLVRSSGTTPFTSGSDPPPLKGTDRPFWASAGPDGNFDHGDDNVYSFRQ